MPSTETDICCELLSIVMRTPAPADEAREQSAAARTPAKTPPLARMTQLTDGGLRRRATMTTYYAVDCSRSADHRNFIATAPQRAVAYAATGGGTADVHYLSWSFTLSRPAMTHGSSTPGEPDSPTPPITSLPTLIGTPPPMAITLGSVVCSRRTGRVAISLTKSSVVMLKVMAV